MGQSRCPLRSPPQAGRFFQNPRPAQPFGVQRRRRFIIPDNPILIGAARVFQDIVMDSKICRPGLGPGRWAFAICFKGPSAPFAGELTGRVQGDTCVCF